MDKYVLMIEDNNPSYVYNKNIIASVQEENVYCVNQFNGLMLKLFQVLFSWKTNKVMEVPFKFLFFKKLLSGIDINKNDDIWFVFFESYLPAYSKKYLRYLKKEYPHAKTCFVVNNPLVDYVYSKVNHVKSEYDKVATFLKDDAEKYGLFYYPYGYPFYIEDGKVKEEYESDVFFVGTDKGRLKYLLNLYDLFEKNGLKCDFWITGTQPEDQQARQGITYNRRIPYTEVLERVRASKCVLEILQDDAMYCSLRCLEALLCRKKLITTNKMVLELPEYDERYIQIISMNNVEKLAIDFIKNDVEDCIFPEKTFCSFVAFKDFLRGEKSW